MRLIALAWALASPLALAHPGGLNAEGCHNNRKTGEYHCHGGGSRSSGAAAPTKQAVAPKPQPGSPTCHVGPRGGTYTITQSGRKNYSGC